MTKMVKVVDSGDDEDTRLKKKVKSSTASKSLIPPDKMEEMMEPPAKVKDLKELEGGDLKK